MTTIQAQCKSLAEVVERLGSTVNAMSSAGPPASRHSMYAVADIRSKNWGSACESADASASEKETGGGDSYETVLSRTARRNPKRKEISPNSVSKKSQKINSTSSVNHSYAAVTGSSNAGSSVNMTASNVTQVNKGAVRTARSDRIIGSGSPCSSLRAAPPKSIQAAKSVFCVSNLDKDVTVDAIREHCKKWILEFYFALTLLK